MTRRVLLALLLTAAPALAAAPPPAKPFVRVAVYDDAGSGLVAMKALMKTLSVDPRLAITRLKADAIRGGKLAGFDVVVFPGGLSNTQGKTLDADGRERVRDFVRGGGGYVGLCAGAYLATNDYSWSLGILNAKVLDKEHWARGVADLDISLSPEARGALGRNAEKLKIRYHQGPILAPGSDEALPKYEAWSVFLEEVAKNGAPQGVMKGKTAIAAADFGKGRVLAFSPHPELTAGLGDVLLRGIDWAARVHLRAR